MTAHDLIPLIDPAFPGTRALRLIPDVYDLLGQILSANKALGQKLEVAHGVRSERAQNRRLLGARIGAIDAPEQNGEGEESAGHGRHRPSM